MAEDIRNARNTERVYKQMDKIEKIHFPGPRVRMQLPRAFYSLCFVQPSDKAKREIKASDKIYNIA